jgi:hypothetical protein
MDLAKSLDICTSSFQIIPEKKPVYKPQIKMIVDLLDKGIKDGRSITIDDVRLIHAEYCYKMRRIGVGYNYYTDTEGTKWRQARTVQEYYEGYTGERTTIPWFKNNLADAILKGKILAIPIIEIN